ncbi:MAG: hypothetical protein HN353_10530 [Bdellovibrionales bacterium]|nr:hypothetical protein [Bdellovibrionales bacterium]MBT3524729.1 hypothetical protein [Bdellovibrionales bacterium]MBT7669199.1 hypothetical protein [Bdellovibrionales bacterium]MBT7767136.1 hypothetical protein [Bdellovibrionales bacterium]
MKNIELRSLKEVRKIRALLQYNINFFDSEQDELVEELFTLCPKAVGMMILNKIHSNEPWENVVTIFRKQQGSRKKWVPQQN